MASEKRDRQRANREVKQAAQQKVDRRQNVFGRARRVTIWAVVGVVLFFLANLVFGSSSDNAAGELLIALAGYGV